MPSTKLQNLDVATQKMLDECSQALKQELVTAIGYNDFYYARRYLSALEGIQKASRALENDWEKSGKTGAKLRADNKKAMARRA